MTKKKKIIIAAAFAVLVLALAVLYFCTRPSTSEGMKNITVTTIFADGTTEEHMICTNAEYLYDAIQDFVTGSESDYGFFITGVDGYEADSSNEEWWCINDGDGNMLSTGASETPVSDGDSYQLVLVTGYDF